jgi:hypothetical protein
MNNPVITESEVAELLRLPIHAFRCRRARMQRDGFPPPIGGAPLRWSRGRVLAWIDGVETRVAAPHADAPRPLSPSLARLERRRAS